MTPVGGQNRVVRTPPCAAHQHKVSSNLRTSAFYDRAAVTTAVRVATSATEALRTLGYAPKPNNFIRLKEACVRYRIRYPARRQGGAITPRSRPVRGRIRDRSALVAALDGAASAAQVLKRLGVSTARKNYLALVDACHEYGLTPPEIRPSGRPAVDAGTRFGSRENFVDAISLSSTRAEVLELLGRPKDYDWLHEAAHHHGVDLPRLVRTRPARMDGQRRAPSPRSLDTILVENSSYKSSGLKKRLVREGVLEDLCKSCGLGPVWNGRPITLQLDHRNGVSNDHRLENLRILCPNCHSQTDTWTGRNIGRDRLTAA